MSSFAVRLRKARMDRRMSQADLARVAGVSQASVANYESGMRTPRDTLYRLSQALAVDPGWLFGGHSKMSSWPFSGISVNEYFALSDADRHAIESLVSRLLSKRRND